jgi:omega-6 fatty acid desaturase (delta-12 desaturase)
MLWFRRPDAVIPNLSLIGYLLLAYPLSLYGLSQPLWFALSVLLLANALVLSAFLLHDCLHNSVLASAAANELLGKCLAWLVGAVYSPYAVLRDKHYRHHIERADILAVNYPEILQRHPLVDRCVRWASNASLPAVDVLLHVLEMLAPFHLPQRRHLRWRNLRILALRASLFGLLCYVSPLAALGYVIAYLLFLSVMGFMDAFQHSYDIYYRLLSPQQKPARDRDYEEHNTYSNLLSARYPLLNLLVLNFCYHNVHHQKPSEPWYRLPALHAAAYPDDCPQLVPLRQQLARFHRYRMDRIYRASAGQRAGADGVSFLVGV